MPIRFNTQSQVLADRTEYWSHAVCSQVVSVEIDQNQDPTVRAGLTSAIVGATKTIDGFGGNHTFNRTVAGIRNEDPDALLLAFPATGSSVVEQDGRQAAVPNGGMAFLDTSRPFQVVMRESFQWQIFAVPKAALRLSTAQLQDITAISIPCTPGVSRLAQEVLKNMISHSSALESDPEAEAIGGHATDLIATLIRSAFAKDAEVGGKAAVLHEGVLAFIRRYHSDPQLSPAMIARAHHVSPRTLYNAFLPTGCSLMDTVRSIRLDRARDDLTNPYFGLLSVAQIALSHGFASPSDFSRTFRASYGATPTEYRKTTRGLLTPREPLPLG